MTNTCPQPDIDIAAAVNDEKVLANCLQRSADIAGGGARLRTYVGFSTAGLAYNQALEESTADYLVLAHQDVYLPKGFLEHLREKITELNQLDPQWAVAGAIGLDMENALQGMVWSSGLRRVIGARPAAPIPAICLDELLLIVRRAAGLRFDEKLPSFHMYGVDIIHIAKARGLSCYVIDAPVIHHSRPVITLSGGYHEAYRYMQSKWRASLPMRNLICTVYPTSLLLIWRNIQLRRRHRGKTVRPEPAGDPVVIAREVGFETAA